MNAHLNKPIDPRELYSALLSWIAPGEREVPAGLGESEDDNDPLEGTLSIPGLDTAAGIERIGGNEASYRKLLRKFVDNQAGAIDEIIAARKEGDNDSAVRAAHTLKGVGGSIGAGALQRLGAELEHGLKESPQGDFDALLTATRDELQRLVDAITAELGEGHASGGEAVEPLPSDYQQRLQALAVQLAEYDGEASDTLGQLIEEVGDPQERTQLEKLAKLVDQYDYESAQALLDELMA
jgi:HPt (histidine-containing phosphotransfer) domain-containing protein